MEGVPDVAIDLLAGYVTAQVSTTPLGNNGKSNAKGTYSCRVSATVQKSWIFCSLKRQKNPGESTG